MLRRADLPRAIAAMQAAGFIYQKSFGVSLFLDGPQASPRDAVQIDASWPARLPAPLAERLQELIEHPE